MTMLNIQKAVVTTTIKIHVETLEVSKYTQYRILVPHNNGNFKLTGLEEDQARPHKSQKRVQE